MELLHCMVSENTAPARVARYMDAIKRTRLTNGDDIEAYLTTFERMMCAYGIAKERRPFKLAPQLAYAALSPEAAKDYDEVKAAILRQYNISEEMYCQRFQSIREKHPETRLTDLATRWTRECGSKEEILDLIIKEQLLRMQIFGSG